MLVVGLVVIGVVAQRVGASNAAPTYRTAKVMRGAVADTVTVAGAITPSSTVKLAFKVGGRVAQVLVSVGDAVTAGQPLARLDTTDLEIAQRTAAGNLAAAQARADQSVAAVADSQRLLEETRRSAANDLASARLTFEKLRTAYASSKSSFGQLTGGLTGDALAYENGVDTARAQTQTLQTDLMRASQSADVTAARAALLAAQTSLANASANATGVLENARAIYVFDLAQLQATIDQFDAALASGADASAASTAYLTAQSQFAIASTKLSNALTAVSSSLALAQTAAGTAQASLYTTTSLNDLALDVARADALTLQSQLTQMLQLGAATSLKVASATTADVVITDAISGSYLVAQQAVSSAEARASSAVTTAQAAANARPFDVAAAQAAVQIAQAALDTTKANLDSATLRASVAGSVASLFGQPGEIVTTPVAAPSPFVVLTAGGGLALHGTVGSADVARLRPGMTAAVVLDSVAKTGITGKITALDPVGVAQQGVPSYGVDVTIDAPDAAIRAGMTGVATITVSRKTDVLLVPTAALHIANGKRTVQVIRDAAAAPVDVEVSLGVQSDASAEVLSGVKEGDVVVVSTQR